LTLTQVEKTGATELRLWDGEAEEPGGLEVDDQLDLRNADAKAKIQ
jgi:hypothetical protein